MRTRLRKFPSSRARIKSLKPQKKSPTEKLSVTSLKYFKNLESERTAKVYAAQVIISGFSIDGKIFRHVITDARSKGKDDIRIIVRFIVRGITPTRKTCTSIYIHFFDGNYFIEMVITQHAKTEHAEIILVPLPLSQEPQPPAIYPPNPISSRRNPCSYLP